MIRTELRQLYLTEAARFSRAAARVHVLTGAGWGDQTDWRVAEVLDEAGVPHHVRDPVKLHAEVARLRLTAALVSPWDSLPDRVLCLALDQPYASLLFAPGTAGLGGSLGRKRVETRTWPWPYEPGWLVVYATRQVDRAACARLGLDPEAVAELGVGALLGVVYVGESRPMTLGDEAAALISVAAVRARCSPGQVPQAWPVLAAYRFPEPDRCTLSRGPQKFVYLPRAAVLAALSGEVGGNAPRSRQGAVDPREQGDTTMRLTTFTGLAAVFGKDRPVSFEKADGDTFTLAVGGLSPDEGARLVRELEGLGQPGAGAAGSPAKPTPTAAAPAAATAKAAPSAAAPAPAKAAAASPRPATVVKPAPAPAPAAPALDPAGPEDGDGAAVADDPWGLSTTPIPESLFGDNAKLRDVINFVKTHIKGTEGEDPTEAQIAAAVESLRSKVPLVNRIAPEAIARRVSGVLQVLSNVGTPPAAAG